MDLIIKEANSHILKGRKKWGLWLATSALKVYPNHPEAWWLRSSIYKSMGLLNECIEDLSIAKTYCSSIVGEGNEITAFIRDFLSSIYNMLTLQQMHQKNYSLALQYINDAISNNSKDINAHLNKGDCYMIQKDIINAKEEFLICWSIDPGNTKARLNLAHVYYKLAILSYNSKDYDEALEFLNNAIGYYTKSDDIYVLRARTYLKWNKVKEAYDDAGVAYYLNPKNQDAIEIRKFLQ